MSFKNKKVLQFYEKLPFNIFGNLRSAEEQIKKFNPLDIYPEIKKIISSFKKPKISKLKSEFQNIRSPERR